MRFNSSPERSIYTVGSGIYVLYGVVTVRVNHGQLVLNANIFDNRSSLTLTKGSSRLTRLVILGHCGSITFEALRWLNDIRAGIIQIDYDASVIMASASPGPDVPKLRRAQALARDTDLGIEIIRNLITRKAIGQLNVYNRIEGPKSLAVRRMELLIEQLDNARSLTQIQTIESQIAVIYWGRWANIPILFARKDKNRIPNEWKNFGTRISPLSRSPKKACSPANAVLNYLYALLDAETRIACLTMGLDPGIGILHADQLYRDSMVYDLMEAVRPDVDLWLLDLLNERRFSKSDFYETTSGQIKLTKHLAHELVQTMPLWTKLIVPITKEVTSNLLQGKVKHLSPSPVAKSQLLNRSCIECGIPIKKQKWFCSPECRRKYEEHIPDPSFIMAGPGALKKLRAKSIDPAHGGEAARKRGQSNRARSNERKAWDATHSRSKAKKERARFKTEILPSLEGYSIRQIANVTGFCLRYCSMIRSGKVVPHPVHNAKLIKLINPAE
jgi:CRISPR-associated endonuclease Cas1